MKRYKDGKFIEIPKEEAEKIQKSLEKFRNTNKQRNTSRPSFGSYESRIKALEENMTKVLAKLGLNEEEAKVEDVKEEVVEKTTPEEA